MPGLLRDFLYAIRNLRRTPGFAAVVVAVLALGIGANTAIFSVVNALLLKPLAFPDADRLVEVYEARNNGGYMSPAYPNYLDWQKQNQVFEQMGAYLIGPETLTGTGNAERVLVGYVSASYLPVFRLRATIGRDLTTSDDSPSAPPVVLLSDSCWKARYGGDPGILNRTVQLDRRSYTVVGVLPPFSFYRKAEYYAPISFALDKYGLLHRENHNNLSASARLKPGVSLQQARAQFQTIAAKLAAAFPSENGGMQVPVVPLRQMLSGDSRGTVLMLLGAVGLVLLVACSNVANLLIARASTRQKEIAIRAAIGASRAQIVQQTLIECLVLAAAGAVAGLGVARLSTGALLRQFPDVGNTGGIDIDWRVMAFAFGAALFTAVLFGLFPAMQVTRVSLTDAMKDSAKSTGGSKLRKALIVSEIAVAVVLLVGSGLLMRSLFGLLNVQPGFRTEHLLVARVSIADVEGGDISQQVHFFERLLERARVLPGVKSAGTVSFIPMAADETSDMVFYFDDRPIPRKGQFPDALHRVASPGYFEAMGIPLLKGRLFDASDGRVPPLKRDMETMMAWWRQTEFKVLINETMARRFWPNQDPIGKSFRPGFPEMKGPRATIIGVVGDTRHFGLGSEPAPEFYDSLSIFPNNSHYLVLRTSGEPLSLAQAVRTLVNETDSSAVVTNLRTMQDVVSASVADRKTNVGLLGTFAGLALVLAVVGIYGVMAYLVTQRKREIGIRMALGAETSQVMRAVFAEAMLLAGIGIVAGAALSFALTRWIASMLYGVTALDAPTYVGVASLLLAATAIASWIPARRAMRVDPAVALRGE